MWHHDAFIYQVDPSLFLDSDGDGWGDLRGVERRLEHVRALGASTLWLLPFYRSPFRDGGYDVSDHLAVDPRFGDIADFVALLERAESLGLRILVELVMQHTSDQHPWFQAARSDRGSPYRDYYVWSDQPVATEVEPIFPTVEDSVWCWDERAGQFYRHVFYAHEPDLNLANPRVREELYRIMGYWLRLGVSGFRIDAVPYMVERARQADPRADGLWLLQDMHRFAWSRRPGAVLMGEADVSVDEYTAYFNDGTRLTHLLDFWINNYLFLALARQRAEPLAGALHRHAWTPPRARHAMWLRNHDELDLEQLTPEERGEVMRAFAPDPRMRIYGRGIRRRLATMLEGDERRIAMAYALLTALPGTPVLRYGDEIGMGDDLDLEERRSVRTPMQWNPRPDTHGGFSAAPAERLVAPPIAAGRYGYGRCNVQAQAWRAGSLLARIRDMMRARLSLPEFAGRFRILPVECAPVLGICYEDPDIGSATFAYTNLAPEPVRFESCVPAPDRLHDVLGDAEYAPAGGESGASIALNGYGYRWLRHPPD